MRAALVAPRNKTGIARIEFRQCLGNVFAFGFGRVGGGANQHKVVVHDRKALDGKAFSDDFFLGHLVVHKQHVGVAAPAHVYRLAGADRHHLDLYARGFLELGQQIREKPGLLGRGGRSHHDRWRLRY